MKNPSEHQEQVAVCQLLDRLGVPYFAVPNGGHRDIVTAARLKAEGVKRGVPDLICFLRDVTLALEMKARKGGKVSDEQREWIAFFNAREGWRAHVANGAEEAFRIINAYISSM